MKTRLFGSLMKNLLMIKPDISAIKKDFRKCRERTSRVKGERTVHPVHPRVRTFQLPVHPVFAHNSKSKLFIELISRLKLNTCELEFQWNSILRMRVPLYIGYDFVPLEFHVVFYIFYILGKFIPLCDFLGTQFS